MTTVTTAAVRRTHRWGGLRARYLAGLLVIGVGVAATSLTSTYSLWFLLLGPAAQAIGWVVLPGPLWRRLVVLVPCLLASLVLVAGVDFVGAYAVLLAGWLFARSRPALSYLTLVLPALASFGLKAELHEYGQNWVALLLGALVTVAAAWLASWASGLASRRSSQRAARRDAIRRSSSL